jgi:hypothetical protein
VKSCSGVAAAYGSDTLSVRKIVRGNPPPKSVWCIAVAEGNADRKRTGLRGRGPSVLEPVKREEGNS